MCKVEDIEEARWRNTVIVRGLGGLINSLTELSDRLLDLDYSIDEDPLSIIDLEAIASGAQQLAEFFRGRGLPDYMAEALAHKEAMDLAAMAEAFCARAKLS